MGLNIRAAAANLVAPQTDERPGDAPPAKDAGNSDWTYEWVEDPDDALIEGVTGTWLTGGGLAIHDSRTHPLYEMPVSASEVRTDLGRSFAWNCLDDGWLLDCREFGLDFAVHPRPYADLGLPFRTVPAKTGTWAWIVGAETAPGQRVAVALDESGAPLAAFATEDVRPDPLSAAVVSLDPEDRHVPAEGKAAYARLWQGEIPRCRWQEGFWIGMEPSVLGVQHADGCATIIGGSTCGLADAPLRTEGAPVIAGDAPSPWDWEAHARHAQALGFNVVACARTSDAGPRVLRRKKETTR